ncbi:aspartic protease [Verticillium alfalfae VaMs.102]|uniref:Aspartic protease n=1 Tax=Verticillium alfalfae (strain VaMs.102 / ATCC MYA-4576 / FGSC 10136) TaxID=526221 RepID=C9SML6_VERA1|nr:aspartic protease [Verticillium alfalfae VaMs.102]EEY20031.1 aspartic protease [Verticillium alfalfae VaMs.102]
MYSISYLCLLLAFANAQQNPKVVQTDLIHFKSQASGPFIPLVQFSLENQTINALFDTGSSDIIVPQKGSSICQNPAQQCDNSSASGFVTGAFDTPAGLARVKGLTLQANFVNGAEFNGDFAALDLAMDGQTVTGTTVGIFTSGSLPPDAPLFPVFGVGPVQGEAVGPTQPQQGRKLRRQAGNFANLYPNLPAHMKEIGMIKSNAFSVYTNDVRAKTGSIIYGGIDTAKFEGQLQEVPLERTNDGALPSFVINFSSVSMETGISGGNGKNSSSPTNNGAPRTAAATTDLTPRDGLPVALMDTGAPSILLPAPSMQMLATALGTTFSEQDGLGLIDCQKLTADSAMVFRFNNDAITIRAPMDTLVVPQELVQDARPGQCVLPVFPSQDTAVMGLPMLQSAYVVFDMDGEKLLMAQAKFNVTESSLREYP